MSNYPPGAEHDKRAPYNKKDRDCPICDGSGTLGTSGDEQGIYEEECSHCDGTGVDPDSE